MLSSGLIFLLAAALASLFTASPDDALLVGVAMMFSSTIIGIKLLPTTVLHHRHIGEMMIGLLLLQDLMAIIVLVLLGAASGDNDERSTLIGVAQVLLALPLLAAAAGTAVRYLLLPLISRFDRFHEYIFLLAIGWCLGIAEAAKLLGLSEEIGAFVAGVSIATSPIAQYIAVSLRPLRDFFLILFFFAVGAQFDLGALPQILLPSLCLAVLVLVAKPCIYRLLLGRMSERPSLAWDLGFRLGQASEFSLLIAYIARDIGWLSANASLLIQASTIITLLVSSYIVVLNYPTPIAISDRLRRD